MIQTTTGGIPRCTKKKVRSRSLLAASYSLLNWETTSIRLEYRQERGLFSEENSTYQEAVLEQQRFEMTQSTPLDREAILRKVVL